MLRGIACMFCLRLLSTASADCYRESECPEPIEPIDESDPAYLGECQITVTRQADNKWWAEVLGEPALGEIVFTRRAR